MFKIKNTTSFFVFLICFAANIFSQPDAGEIVRKADLVRAPAISFRFVIKTINYEANKKESNLLRVYSYNRQKSLVYFLKPKKDRGKKILMVNENMWIYIPTSKRPIRITPQQKLMGQASYGDVARTNYYEDYTAKILSNETMNSKKCYKLELLKKTKAATYHKVLYWIQKSNYHPVKAEFYTRSGKLMKYAFFSAYKFSMGRKRPHKVVIYNAIHKSKKTEMLYGRYSSSSLPASRYQRSQLGK